ncbi:OmpG porin family protein [Vibrio sinaloensis]|nr:OmpG porin family protein [Vibrio sinaloensis]
MLTKKISAEDAELKSKLTALEGEYSKAELLTALNAEPKEDSKLHGTIGTNIEIEEWSGSNSRGESWEGGKVKYSLANGNFRHEDLPGVDFGFYMAREFNYNGSLFSADYDGVNDITEIYLNKSYGIENGNIGWGVKYAQESADKRSTPEAKVFGSYQINDWLDIHGYGLYHVEIKQNLGNFDYWEVEPGLGFKIADNMGAWLNFRYQQGTWDEKGVSENNVETETIIKPGMWYSFGKLGTALFAEIGAFENEIGATGKKSTKKIT